MYVPGTAHGPRGSRGVSRTMAAIGYENTAAAGGA